jgi:hypothetical protein
MASVLRSVRVATTLIRPQSSLRLVLSRSYAVKTGTLYLSILPYLVCTNETAYIKIHPIHLFASHTHYPHVHTTLGQFYFTKDHEWVKLDANNVATVGITDHAQHALGDVVFVEVPEKGKTVKQKATLAAVESVKAASGI